MLDEDGIEVATEDKAAWDTAVAEFENTLREARARRATAADSGSDEVEPVPAKHGLNGSGAILA